MFSEALNPATVNATNVQLRNPAAELIPGTVSWDPATRTASLNPTFDLAHSTAYTATIKGGAGGVTDPAGNPLGADLSWTFTTLAAPPADTTPPTVTATSPLAGGSGILVGTNTSATFSEALDPATITGASFELRNDGTGQLVAASVSWDPATLSAELDPTAPLAFGTSYTATVKGGPGGVTDVAGNPLAADFSWSFTTEASFAGVRIWPNPVAPAVPNANDGTPIELGVRFRSSAAGYITGIRFHKGNQNTGTHVGSLWSASGTRLASATFMAETASGWQEVSLDPPVAIAANTTYIASYFSSAGYYSATLHYFTSQATVTGPLTALASGTDGPNGLYRYGASAFPDQTAADANYWVDVVFSTEPPALDTTPPIVITRTPNNGVSGVLVGTNVTAQFSEALAAATVNTGTIELRAPGGALVPAAVTWVGATNSAVLDPTANLAYSTTYTAIVKGGAGGVTDVAGNPLVGNVTWTFTTEATPPPPPDDGSGGPILVITTPPTRSPATTPRSSTRKGLNAFKSLDLVSVDAGVLAEYDVVILGEMAL